jgi:hypothetical protein
MTPNRIVAFLTPLVFAPAAGFVATFAAEQGLNVDSGRLEEIFIAGALIALAPALQWLHGWQKWEQREAEADAMAERLDTVGAVAAPMAADDLSPEEYGYDGYDGYDVDEGDEFEDPLLDGEPVGAGR